jgi:manganese transport protein
LAKLKYKQMLTSRPFDHASPSLEDVNATVSTSHASTWRRMLAYGGPAYLVSVGYMDPGNWATDLEGGARFGYRLLWVIVLSNLMAILLQTLSARLGIVTRRDLAQACQAEYPRFVSRSLWILSEIAIVACDLAEVLGAAIGINLLFKIPVLYGVLITAADTLLVLWFTRMGIRVIEAFILGLIATIAGCFGVEILLAHPNGAEILSGLIPRLGGGSLYIAVGILGATVMPHNLYLHSALVQTRRLENTDEDRRRACHYNFLDSVLALNGALLVNAAILILAAAVFFKHHIIVTEIQQAHQFLTPLLGTTAASLLFGAALLCSGQSSTLTGTMAGQIVMEGFLHLRVRPWLRRAITRALAIIPAALTIAYAGDAGSYQLIILSQVVLNLQLPFAVIPLVQFTSDPRRMGSFSNRTWVKVLAWTTTVLILVLDIGLAWQQVTAWLGGGSLWAAVITVLISLFLVGLLAVVTFWPMLKRRRALGTPRITAVEAAESIPIEPQRYRTILVPIDHTVADRAAMSNAVSLASAHGARLILLHVEEGVTSQVFGEIASTAEVAEDSEYLEKLAGSARADGIEVETVVRHGRDPAAEIVQAATELAPDLLILASHGHRGLMDLALGTTINSVRHHTRVPLLIVPGTGERSGARGQGPGVK